MERALEQTTIATKIIKNVTICFNEKVEGICVPLSTYETPLFASCQRGAKVSKTSPISVHILNDCMTRSVIFQGQKLFDLIQFSNILKDNNFIQNIINKTSKHCILKDVKLKFIGNLLYCRFEFNTMDASGHNISTIASNEISKTLTELAKKKGLHIQYISNSGNMCVDKKVSAINSIMGRGKNVIAEIKVSKEICEKILHTMPEKICELNIQKNLIGSITAGSLCSANAHYANMLAAVFLPFGQDVANIVEGSQGITYCNILNNELYFSVNLPNIICGCVGNGKNINFVKHNLQMIGCLDKDFHPIPDASKRLAGIIGAIVLCGELSLMSALTNQDELVKSHTIIERRRIF